MREKYLRKSYVWYEGEGDAFLLTYLSFFSFFIE